MIDPQQAHQLLGQSRVLAKVAADIAQVLSAQALKRGPDPGEILFPDEDLRGVEQSFVLPVPGLGLDRSRRQHAPLGDIAQMGKDGRALVDGHHGTGELDIDHRPVLPPAPEDAGHMAFLAIEASAEGFLDQGAILGIRQVAQASEGQQLSGLIAEDVGKGPIGVEEATVLDQRETGRDPVEEVDQRRREDRRRWGGGTDGQMPLCLCSGPRVTPGTCHLRGHSRQLRLLKHTERAPAGASSVPRRGKERTWAEARRAFRSSRAADEAADQARHG